MLIASLAIPDKIQRFPKLSSAFVMGLALLPAAGHLKPMEIGEIGIKRSDYIHW